MYNKKGLRISVLFKSSWFLLLLFFPLVTSAGEQRLTADEVRALISDSTVECYHHKKDFSYIVYFDPGGSVRGISTDGRERRATWDVTEDGYHCVHWSDKAGPICHGIFPNGDGTYKRKKRDKTTHGITMKSVVRGNPNNY